MHKKWKSISVTTVLAATLLLGVSATPNAAHLSNGNTTTEAVNTTTATTPVATTGTAASNETKPSTPKKQKSVLDADVLESPFSFFKDLSSGSEDDDTDVTVKSSAVVLALKALAATLLSTIM